MYIRDVDGSFGETLVLAPPKASPSSFTVPESIRDNGKVALGATDMGAVAQAAVDLTKYVLGTNTTTNTTGTTASNSSNFANSNVAAQSSTDVLARTSGWTSTTGNTDTKTSNNSNSTTTTQNTTDPDVIAMLKSLAANAFSNSTDSSKTTGLLSGILQTAGDAMTSIFGQQKQAGIYDSSAASNQTNDVTSRAGADAAAAILGYQTQQETIASTALNQLGSLTSGSIVNNKSHSVNDVNTNTSQMTNVDSTTDTNTNVSSAAQTSVNGGQQSNQTTQSTSSSKTGMSVVCTYMHETKRLSSRRYYVVSKDLAKKPIYIQQGYLAIGTKLAKFARTYPTCRTATIILSIFANRTEYVCSKYSVPGCRKTVVGWLARALIAVICTPTSFYFFLMYLLARSQGKEVYIVGR